MEELKPCLNKVKPTGEQHGLIHKRSILHGITDLLDMASMIHNETVDGDQCMQYVAKRTEVAYRMGYITAWNTRPDEWDLKEWPVQTHLRSKTMDEHIEKIKCLFGDKLCRALHQQNRELILENNRLAKSPK